MNTKYFAPRLRLCPKCGGSPRWDGCDDGWRVYCAGKDPDGSNYGRKGLECGRTGTRAKSEIEAAKVWNGDMSECELEEASSPMPILWPYVSGTEVRGGSLVFCRGSLAGSGENSVVTWREPEQGRNCVAAVTGAPAA